MSLRAVRTESARIRRLCVPYVWFFYPPGKALFLVVMIVSISMIDKALQAYYVNDLINAGITSVVCVGLGAGAVFAGREAYTWEPTLEQSSLAVSTDILESGST